MQFYNKVSTDCSKLVTNAYSTSFSLGIWSLPRKYHDEIYSIYGFVRLADEIVDTFYDHNQLQLLKEFKEETKKAIQNKVSLNPVLNSFQNVVNKYKLKQEWIDAFLYSMEMDLNKIVYNKELYDKYIYGSAEVVGLMCLQVFCNGNDKICDSLTDPAKSLGAAFQKVNFLRDMRSDFEDRGRVYFPNVDFNKFTPEQKKEIEDDISNDFDNALKGIKNLPNGTMQGVYATYIYYKALFNKIKSKPVEIVKEERIRINNIKKFWLLIKTSLQVRLGMV